MIPNEVLSRLVPQNDPKEGFQMDPSFGELDLNQASRRVGLWAAFLR